MTGSQDENLSPSPSFGSSTHPEFIMISNSFASSTVETVESTELPELPRSRSPSSRRSASCGTGQSRDVRRKRSKSGGNGSNSISNNKALIETRALERGLRETKSAVGEDHPDVRTMLLSVGNACYQNGDLSEALRYFRQVESIEKKKYGYSHPAVADILCSIGSVLMEMPSLQESLDAFETAHCIYDNNFRDKREAYEAALRRISPSTKKTDNDKRRKSSSHHSLIERQLELQCKLLSTENSIGNIKFQRNEYRSAMKHYKKAYSLAQTAETVVNQYEWVCDADFSSSSTFVYHSSNASNSSTCSSNKSSSLLLSHGLFGMRILGSSSASAHKPPKHNNDEDSNHDLKSDPLRQMIRLAIADTLSNIASVHAELGRRTDAIEAYRKTLELQTEILGEDDLAVANTLNNLGTMNFRADNLSVAMKCYKQVLKMRRKILDRDHVSVADVLVNIAFIYDKQRDLARTERALMEAIRIAVADLGRFHPKVANIMNSLADFYSRNGRDEDAVELLTDILKLYKGLGLQDDHDLVLDATTNIATIQNEQAEDSLPEYFIGCCDITKTFDCDPAKSLTTGTAENFSGRADKRNSNADLASF